MGLGARLHVWEPRLVHGVQPQRQVQVAHLLDGLVSAPMAYVACMPLPCRM